MLWNNFSYLDPRIWILPYDKSQLRLYRYDLRDARKSHSSPAMTRQSPLTRGRESRTVRALNHLLLLFSSDNI